jgi:hypothetical protein
MDSNVSVKREGFGNYTITREGEGDTSKVEETAKKDGLAFGTMTLKIYEEDDARVTRDAAIEAALASLKVADMMKSVEKKLREQSSSSAQSFYKERQERTQESIAHAREIGKLEDKIKKLEDENRKLRVALEERGVEFAVSKAKRLDKQMKQTKKRKK